MDCPDLQAHIEPLLTARCSDGDLGVEDVFTIREEPTKISHIERVICKRRRERTT
jgi:hypothetical protein